MNEILYGWVHSKRDHGSCLFVDLRNEDGLFQITTHEKKFIDILTKTPLESVIKVGGKWIDREEHQINKNIKSGHQELVIDSLEILSKNNNPLVDFNENTSDETKMKHRVLYLRSAKMQKNLKFRNEVIKFMRNYMESLGFTEIQTPLITFSSPEGARDFIIPSRLHPGKFYALPQAPQIFKQMLMASGFEKYFQIAPCFRDEDARKDRCYGEFYQLDCEMCFKDQDEILKILRDFIQKLIKHFKNQTCSVETYSYAESLRIFGTDKPDLRSPIRIEDYSTIFAESEMDLFKKKVNSGGVVRGITLNQSMTSTTISNSSCKKVLNNIEKEFGFKIAYSLKENDEIKGPLAQFLQNLTMENNSVIFFVCDSYKNSHKKLTFITKYLNENWNLIDKNTYKMAQIVDFPMFEREDGELRFTHNPFSKPKSIENPVENTLAFQYDLVLNGYEICSGSVRNTDPESIISLFKMVGISEEETKKRFSGLLKAFSYGVPPHGGFACGIERIIMILLQETNIRDISAFPLNTNGACPFTNTPTDLPSSVIKNYSLKLV